MKTPPRTFLPILVLCFTICATMAFARSEASISPYEELSPSLQVSPGEVTLQVGQSQKFTATMSGKRTTAVVWSVNNVTGGNSTVGTISRYGNYRAPQVVPSGSVVVSCHLTKVVGLSASAQVKVVPPPSPSGVSLTISPTSTSLEVGQTQQFSATVTGTTNNSVTWLVNGAAGGSLTAGVISSTGLYTAPAAAPAGPVTVTAQSLAQSSATATATVTIITPAPPSVSVSLSPSSTSLQVGQSQQFVATVTGTGNTSVSWSVNGVSRGNTTVGTISPSGLYSAPAAVPSVALTVTAQSLAQSTAKATAIVTLTTPTVSVSLSPTNPSLQVGQSLQFSAKVTGASNSGVNWLVSNTVGGTPALGTISATGLYTAPAAVPNAAVIVTAQSTASPSSVASTSVSLTTPVAHHVDLSWTASASSSTAGYNLYRGTQASGPFTKINSALDTATVYTDSTVVSGQTYYYTTTAADSSGSESPYSNVAQAVIP